MKLVPTCPKCGSQDFKPLIEDSSMVECQGQDCWRGYALWELPRRPRIERLDCPLCDAYFTGAKAAPWMKAHCENWHAKVEKIVVRVRG